MKAVQKTRLVETPFWACNNAEHAHATEPLANACIRASEPEEFTFADIDAEVVPVKRPKRQGNGRGTAGERQVPAKRGRRGV